jgi:hypothetical protein
MFQKSELQNRKVGILLTPKKKKWPPSLVMRSGYFPHFLSIGLGVDRVCGDTGTVFGPGFFPVRSGRQMTLVAILTHLLSGAVAPSV